MKNKSNSNRKPRASRPFGNLMKGLIICTAILTGFQSPLKAQTVQYEQPTWRFGVAGNANLNFYQGTTQRLHGGLMAPKAFGHGNGIGLFVAPMIEYHRPESLFGFMIQAGYDSRKGDFDQVMTPCNCPADLSTELSYITIEPSIRMAPFRSNFYLFAGPRLAFGLDKSFEYNQDVNPDFPNSSQPNNVIGDFSEMDKTQVSLQIGTGWDIPINSNHNRTQYTVSPFASFHPYFGQSPRLIETWNITTFRAGVAIKFGRGKRIESQATMPMPVAIETAPLPEVYFTVNSPKNAPADPVFIESFPLRNFVFFDRGSTSIPNRYILLNKAQATDFNDNQIAPFNQIVFAGSSSHQMTVYYNILNILGDRMVKNPISTITLVGSSENGVLDAELKAESVKSYLVNIFGITASRINTEGSNRPKLSSVQRAGSLELELLRQEDSRVSVESSSPTLLTAYQTGPYVVQEAPSDSYVTFNVDDENRTVTAWRLEVTDEAGNTQNFGPYTNANVSLPGKTILGDRSRGNYNVTMIGETSRGTTIRRETSVEVVLWEPPVVEHGTRYSVIYEFDNSTATPLYERYLTDVVTPAIPAGATIRIHGYTDTIGDTTHNLQLSQARAGDVRTIIQRGLDKTSQTNVRFEVTGYGEGTSRSPFGNTYPEERFYNRTVIIDIIPAR